MRFSGKWFLIALLMVQGAACQSQQDQSALAVEMVSSAATVLDQREYEVQQSLELINGGLGQPEKQNLWVTLNLDFPLIKIFLSGV